MYQCTSLNQNWSFEISCLHQHFVVQTTETVTNNKIKKQQISTSKRRQRLFSKLLSLFLRIKSKYFKTILPLLSSNKVKAGFVNHTGPESWWACRNGWTSWLGTLWSASHQHTWGLCSTSRSWCRLPRHLWLNPRNETWRWRCPKDQCGALFPSPH